MPSAHILRELKRIHPGLFVLPCDYAIDDQGFIHHSVYKPRYHVMLHDEHGRDLHLFAVEATNGEFMPLDTRTVLRLKTDISRFEKDPKKIDKLIRDMEAEDRRRVDKQRDEDNLDVLMANRKKISEAIDNMKDGIVDGPAPARDEKIMSYPGQTKRSSGRDNILLSAKEQGYELKEHDDE